MATRPRRFSGAIGFVIMNGNGPGSSASGASGSIFGLGRTMIGTCTGSRTSNASVPGSGSSG